MQLRHPTLRTWMLLGCTTAVCAALGGVPLAAAANDTESGAAEPRGETPPRRPHGPPPEAITACESAEAGDSCSFQLDDQTIEGTCRAGRNADQPLACMPQHPPRRPP